MSLTTEGVETVEKECGDFVLVFTGSKSGNYITIKSKYESLSIQPVTFHLIGGPRTEPRQQSVDEPELHSILSLRAAESGLDYSGTGEIYDAIESFVEELVKKDPVKYADL